MNLKDPTLLRHQAFIDGEWQGADDGATFEVVDPSNGASLGTVPKMGAAETRRAIDAANAAWPAWRKKTAKERAAIMRRWYDLMIENADDLALILTTEQGKPLAEAKGEIAYAASFIEWFAEEGKRVAGDTLASPAADKRIVVTKEPIGVCAAITPWNFPAAMITRKVGPALAAGCPIVVKPAEATPFSAFAMAVLAERAGVPKGVLNILTGDPKAIGGEMTSNPIVRKLSFTGSTAVGRLLAAQSAPTVKKVYAGTGRQRAVHRVRRRRSRRRRGRRDGIEVSQQRADLRVHEPVLRARACLRRSSRRSSPTAVGKLKVGRGTESGVALGPLINEAAVLKVESHIEDALTKGASIVTGGKRHALGHGFFEPTVLTGVTPDMKVAKEETFGPLAPIFKFSSDEEVVQMANDTEFGLAAYFYSRDIGRVWRVAEALEYGMVGINTGLISNEVAPFGGVKQSGLGREGSHYGIDDYVVIKYLCMAV